MRRWVSFDGGSAVCLSYSCLLKVQIEDCSNTPNLVVNGGKILQNLLQTSRSAFSVVKHCSIFIWDPYCNRSEQDHFKLE